jgi:hypothetical protein
MAAVNSGSTLAAAGGVAVVVAVAPVISVVELK